MKKVHYAYLRRKMEEVNDIRIGVLKIYYETKVIKF